MEEYSGQKKEPLPCKTGFLSSHGPMPEQERPRLHRESPFIMQQGLSIQNAARPFQDPQGLPKCRQAPLQREMA